MKSFKILVSFFFSCFFLTSCFDNSYGGAPVDEGLPQKLVFIHTTDTHGKYLPFWMEPNMFDRNMGLQSSNPPCWDLDYSGGGSYCNGVYNDATGKYQVYENGKYVYYTKEELIEKGYYAADSIEKGLVIEDINEDGRCDILDCQRCWDTNHNNICDPEEDLNFDPVENTGRGCGSGDCWDPYSTAYITCWDKNGNGECDKSEDINFDGWCDTYDCALVYDRNHNGKCDYPYDSMRRTWRDENGKLILSKNFENESEYKQAMIKAEKESEDINRDGKCDYSDYRPGLINTGGIARAKTVIEEIREKHSRNGVPVLYLDSGDTFQGAPEFNLYKGDIEMLSMQKLGVDAMVIGNHEFDNGTGGLVSAYKKSGGFPLLASNYLFDNDGNKGLMDISSPYLIAFAGGLTVGIVGVANDSSLNSGYQVGGSMGLNFLDPIETTQSYVNSLRPLVDIIVILSHQGLDGDYKIAEKVKGVDLILGGHHHVVLDPPKILKGPDGRDVIVVHSGVNLKVVGELEIAVQNKRIVWHKYRTIPLTEKIEENGDFVNMLKPYVQGLDYSQYLQKKVGQAVATIVRNDPANGDSPLGNIVTTAMMNHELARAQFAVTNSMGIRADIPTGEITLEKLYEVFPFENSITTMYLSGNELKTLFDFVARKSATRGCKTQVQVAGIGVELDCNPSEELQKKYNSYALTKCLQIGNTVVIDNYEVLLPNLLFKMATNDYMGRGGSGFYMLEANTTRLDTSVSLRDAVVDFFSLFGEINPIDFSLNQTKHDECGRGKRILMIN
ncbi:bifunctional metallophosphatase/5'-nucleotidase [bacterium]|nr:bifunctional metallophosphatase/5'-nucleotidase [bacterium]